MRTKLQRAVPIPLTDAQIAQQYERAREANPQALRECGAGRMMSLDEYREIVVRKLENTETWKNDEYTVAVHRQDDPPPGWPKMVHLSIRRNDRQPVRDWRDMQEIKNQLVGEENEGVELYPAESRLVDLANQFHLWVLADAGIQFPFGFGTRAVDSASVGGAVQRARDGD